MLPRPPISTLFPYTTLFRSTAMAISGAAAAPQMGTGTIKSLSFWLALFNIRLRSEEHTSELQSHSDLVCRLLLEKKKTQLYTSPCTNGSSCDYARDTMLCHA